MTQYLTMIYLYHVEENYADRAKIPGTGIFTSHRMCQHGFECESLTKNVKYPSFLDLGLFPNINA